MGVSGAAQPVVWLLDTTGASLDRATVPECLSASERARLDRFQRPLRRVQFLAGRLLARHAISHRLGMPWHDVVLLDRPGAAPLLQSPSTPSIAFSLSHSGSWVACAVGEGAAVGLDIEVLDCGRDVLALAEQAFDATLRARLADLEPGERAQAFYAEWTALEARIKLARPAHSMFSGRYGPLSLALASDQQAMLSPALRLATLSPDGQRIGSSAPAD